MKETTLKERLRKTTIEEFSELGFEHSDTNE